jgi:hypothetical protein
MKRFDLGMSINYCMTWGIVESIRELFQNAVDAQTANPENTMYFNYDAENEILRIGNKNGNLATKTLLLGQTSKLGDERMIGQHGEGYKVATVVLMRNGKGVKIYNRSEKEVWTAKVVKSRRYQADVVVYDIEKVSIFKSVPNHDLIFEVSGITKGDYDAIVNSNLHLQELKSEDVIQVGDSRILIDDAHSGKLYVGGLYVTTSKYAKLGYDFEPTLIQLDRDRSFIDGLDLQFICGKLIAKTGDADIIAMCKNLWDGEYIRWYIDNYKDADLSSVFDKSFDDFVKSYGSDAVPCTSTNEFNMLHSSGYKPVLVSTNDYYYITKAKDYSSVSVPCVTNKEVAEKLEGWFNEYVDSDSEGYDEGLMLVRTTCERLRAE